MNDTTSKKFDCVQNMREIRDRISSEIANMSHEELIKWLRGHRYTDPLLKKLSEKAVKETDPSNRT